MASSRCGSIRFGLLVLVASLGCGGAERAPDATRRPPMVESRALDQHLGTDVTLLGRVSSTPWQHLIGIIDGKRAEYFDPSDGGPQIVVYVAGRIDCAGEVELSGRVFEARGPSKRPGGRETKVDDSYAELQLDVAAWRCRD